MLRSRVQTFIRCTTSPSVSQTFITQACGLTDLQTVAVTFSTKTQATNFFLLEKEMVLLILHLRFVYVLDR